MKKLTRVDVLKAQEVKNPGNMPILIASQFIGDEDSDHTVLQYDPVKKMYSFHGKGGNRPVDNVHFYMDRAITEYNQFTIGE